MIPQEKVGALIAATDHVAFLLAQGVELRRQGRTWGGICPFHGGKSFTVYADHYHCYGCDEHGNAITFLMKVRGLTFPEAFEAVWRFTFKTGPGLEPIQDRRPEPKPTGKPIDVARAWSDYQQLAGDDWQYLAAYLTDVRRWPADLIAELRPVLRDHVRWALPIQRDVSRPADELSAQVMWARQHKVLTVLRDADGRPRDVIRRWSEPKPVPDDQPKTMRLSAERTGRWGVGRTARLALLGSLPEALAAARRGEPIFLVEGDPDWWLATWWCRVTGRGAVIGTAGANELHKAAGALAAALRKAKISANVYLVPHLGDKIRKGKKRGVGEEGMAAAAKELENVATIRWVRVPVSALGKGDLADIARDATNAAGIREVIDRIVREAQVINWVDGAPEIPDCEVIAFAQADVRVPELIAHELRSATAERLKVVAITTGAGKTRAALLEAARLAAEGETVVFAVLDHAKADEAEATVRNLVPAHVLARISGGFEVVRGALYHCHYFKKADEVAKARIEAAFAHGGRGLLCDGCPLRASCPGANRSRAARGSLTICTMAALPTLKMPKGVTPLVVIDEAPNVIEIEELPLAALSEPLNMLMCRNWRRYSPDAVDALRRVVEVLRRVAKAARALAREANRPEIVSAKQVWKALASDEALADIASRWHVWEEPEDPFGGALGAAPRWVIRRPSGPPEIDGQEAREPRGRFPNPAAWSLVAGRRTAPHKAAPRAGGIIEALIEGRPTDFGLQVPPRGPAVLLLPTAFKVPSPCRAVVLDAAGHLLIEDYATLAAANGLAFAPEVDLTRLAVRGAPPARAMWLDAVSYSRPNSLKEKQQPGAGEEDPLIEELDPLVPGRLQRALVTLRAAANEIGRREVVVGHLLWKLMATEMEKATAQPVGHAVGAALQELLAEARAHGLVDAYVGYHGRDGVATNVYLEHKCDALVIYGDRRPNLGVLQSIAVPFANEIRVAAEIQPVTASELFAARTAAAALQEVGRARASRPEYQAHPWLLVYCGTSPPALLEAPWIRIGAAPGRIDTFHDVAMAAALAKLADGWGYVAEKEAMEALAAQGLAPDSRHKLQDMLRDLVDARCWSAFPVGRRTVFAPELEAAKRCDGKS